MTMLSTVFKPLDHIPNPGLRPGSTSRTVHPDRVVIPLEYPGQILYRPQVRAGDVVSKNQIIGRSDFGNCVHASISGVVKEIKPVWTARSFNVPAVTIEGNGEPPLSVKEMFRQYGIPFSSATPTQKLQACGVISPWTLPGRFHHEEDIDGFPEIEHVVVKGANEETTIFIWELLLQRSDAVNRGFSHLADLAPGATIHLTVPKHLVGWATETFGRSVSIVGLSPEYKDRIEQLVVPRLTGVRVPNQRPYRAGGVAVLSVEYLLTIVAALDDGVPFVEKHLTVATRDAAEACTVTAPIGTPIHFLLEGVGLGSRKRSRVLVGGPMKGIAQHTDETPVTKSSHGTYLVSEDEVPEEINLPCINCGRCTQVCPVNLQVHLIGRYVEYGMLDPAAALHPEACFECGLCAYVCPAHRPLVQLIKISNDVQGEVS